MTHFLFAAHVLTRACHLLPNPQVVYEWTSTDATPWQAIPAPYNSKNLVMPGPVRGATAGQAYGLKLRAYIAGHADQASEATVLLRAQGSPRVARLRGPTGDFKETATVRAQALHVVAVC